jgi:hypothetical protein
MITSLDVYGNDFTLNFDTIAGKTYVIEYKDSLEESMWQVLQSITGDGSLKTISQPLSAAFKRFFRLSVRDNQ